MKWSGFPAKIRTLEPYTGRFQAFRLRADGCEILFGTYPAGTRIEAHRHDTDNWGVITKGAMTIIANGIETTYRPGDWYHVPAQMEHAARCDSDTEEIEFWFQAE